MIEFFSEYQDEETKEIVKSHKKIASYYIKTLFFVDLIATFPYELVTGNYYTTLFRLLRLMRMGEVLALFDISNSLKFFRKCLNNDSRGWRVMFAFIMINVFKIFQLIIYTITIIYFLGCLWFLICNELN